MNELPGTAVQGQWAVGLAGWASCVGHVVCPERCPLEVRFLWLRGCDARNRVGRCMGIVRVAQGRMPGINKSVNV